MVELVELPALEGTNPLAFLAALGVLTVGDRVMGPGAWRLGWHPDIVPRPFLAGAACAAEVVDAVLEDREAWRTAAVLQRPDDDVKFDRTGLQNFVAECASDGDAQRSGWLAAALLTEGSFDGKVMSKPTDLHFTAGQQKFLLMARQLRDGIEPADITEALVSGWRYQSDLPSLKWDVTDDRLYAFSASDPATTKKFTVPGAEWLALLGLALLPVYTGPRRTITTACEGTWKSGSFTWPLWTSPTTRRGAMTYLAHVGGFVGGSLLSSGVFRVLRCSIRRSEQGGYGTFAPPRIIWAPGD